MLPAQHQGCSHSVQAGALDRGYWGGERKREYPSLSLSGKQSNCRTHCTAELPSQSSCVKEGRHGGSPVLADRGAGRVQHPVALSWSLHKLDCVLSKESTGEGFVVVCSLSQPGKISDRAGGVHYVPCLLIQARQNELRLILFGWKGLNSS